VESPYCCDISFMIRIVILVYIHMQWKGPSVVNSLTWYQPKQCYTAFTPPSLHHSRRRPLSTPTDRRRLTLSLSSPLPPTMATLPMQPFFFLYHVAPYGASMRRSGWRHLLHGSSTRWPWRRPYGTSSYGAPPGVAPYAGLP
jgi:hypothetical protein